MPERIVRYYHSTNQELAGLSRDLEYSLQQQVIVNLHQLEIDDWLSDLERYRHDEKLHLGSIKTVEDQLDLWLVQLDDVMQTIPPRDVTLDCLGNFAP